MSRTERTFISVYSTAFYDFIQKLTNEETALLSHQSINHTYAEFFNTQVTGLLAKHETDGIHQI